MFPLDIIKERNRVATILWCVEHKQPYVVTREDISDWRDMLTQTVDPALPLPALLNTEPEGWQAAGEWVFQPRDSKQTQTVMSAMLEALAPGEALSVIAVDYVRQRVTVARWRRTLH